MGMNLRIPAIVIAAGLVLTACGSGGETAAVPESAPVSAPGGETPAATNLEAVMVPTADGGELDFNSLRGQDVMLWFWAPW
jgi:hypothetical protein